MDIIILPNPEGLAQDALGQTRLTCRSAITPYRKGTVLMNRWGSRGGGHDRVLILCLMAGTLTGRKNRGKGQIVTE
ncbi:hypothetical protein AA3990_2546 [Gluconobacter roseus NBRC 3990]|nr:hypothetical protein AA3990_2546 [Gluconobacter roseus NBRC 3990]